ncbi:MAG TPA: carboxymuconolactone decarboxylase family protein [Nitrospinota bacterium]|jgi:AhpD family alkylhydroperoxidase|nr:carboxymuconolactone decarboxylase family protein [Nitrospinota bacterium]|tara:strand:+ start:5151 stop:5576 length:426 start_codon:yes stop_codon:yes gene_type:complete
MSFEEEFKKLVDEKGEEGVKEILDGIEKLYGYKPLVTRVLAENKLSFLTSVLKNRALLHPEDGVLNDETIELITISAATVLRCDYCLEHHIQRAFKLGVSNEAVFQTIMLASSMAESASWSTGFRKYRQMSAKFYGKEEKE